MSGYRLSDGGLTDRGTTLRFSFDGTAMSGHSGDTIASALLANGVRIVGRSFKYHRPRGLWGAWVEDPNGIVDVAWNGRTTPNLRATTEPLINGQEVRSVNAAPTAAGDRWRKLDLVSRFLPAGFYYKTFMWPRWERYEPRIRALAGLGRLDPGHEPAADCAQVNARCDLLVVGAGPAGLAAARAAAARGETVLLVDDQDAPGGALRWRGGTIAGSDWRDWAEDAVSTIKAAGGRVLFRTTAYGVYDHGLVCAWRRREAGPDQLWRIRPGRTLLAAGAIERPLTFADNDRPGVMSADAALRYLRLYAVVAGRRIAVATNNDAAYPVAAALAQAGADVSVLDSRDDSLAMAECALAVERNTLPSAALGQEDLTGVLAGDLRLEADTLLVSGGWTPTIHLWRHAGGGLRYDERLAAFLPEGGMPAMRVAGAANGAFGLAAALADGHAAGGDDGPAPPVGEGHASYAIRPAWPDPAGSGRAWIDQQSDVTVKDVALAAREGFRSVEHLKRYTTLGMATDQGKTSNMAGLAAMASITGRAIPEVGTTTFRPPYVPVPLPVIAGRRRGQLFNPPKRLELEGRHREAVAGLREYGGWLRPSWYGADGAAAIDAEARAARRAVGLLDASPLGKIEVIGPDAAALLDFECYNRVSTLKVGRARYVLMLTEAGIVYDDGVVMRLAEDRFIVSCSSAHVAGVRMRLEEWRQDRFDPARVFIHDATAHWATIAATGPKSRDLLEATLPALPRQALDLAHMAVTETALDDAPLRIARVSFTGERSYELSVPQSAAAALWDRLTAGLATLGGCRLGLEALLILRAEKGYPIIGKDTDGLTMPHDLGMTGPMKKREDEFAGRRALFTPQARGADRRQLVGLAVDESAEPLPTGAHGYAPSGGRRRSIGYVTSSYLSPELGRPIALALIENGRERLGERIPLVHLDATFEAMVTSPVAYDPAGMRLDA